MILLISILALLFLLSAAAGYRQYLRLEHLNAQNVSFTLLASMLCLVLLSVAYWSGLLEQALAADITAALYTTAGGFFIGNGIKLMVRKRRAGTIDYMQRSFWIDIAPNLISLLLVSYGIYRTGIMTLGPFNAIGITSGLSLIGFGFFGWTVRIVPEFRNRGILILDLFIPWKHLLAFEWHSEEVLTIDYLDSHKKICEFSTSVPAAERRQVEELLNRRLREHREERKKELDPAASGP